MTTNHLYSIEAIRVMESYSISGEIKTGDAMMSAAAASAFSKLKQSWPNARNILVVCGKGNNGGDGYALACLAKKEDFDVKVCYLVDPTELKGEALNAANACQSAGVPLLPFEPGLELSADVIIDAILGIGVQGEVQSPSSDAIQSINESTSPVLAMDLPSGIQADTGEVLGVAVKADLTVTFIGIKQGLVTNQAPEYVGELLVSDLDLPSAVFDQVIPTAELLGWDGIWTLLPPRHRGSHKGCYGHVLVIGGDYGMGGAVRMAAEAAMRVGAGLVSVATRPEHVPIVNCSRPEIMCHQVTHSDDLEPLLARATVIVIGPGLGQSEWANELLKRILDADQPKVLDADSLNLIAQAPRKHANWILTPHPGEAGRLLATNSKTVQSDRYQAATAIQQQYGGVAVLKGAGTVIKSESGRPAVCPYGNPGMATGGMGDILSGVIGGLLAQSLNLKNAAEAGVFVHARAADIAAAEGGERGLLATDLLKHLRSLVNPDTFSGD